MEKKKKILVVDDEPSVTFTISGVLQRLGPDYEMARAFDKDKALEIIESQRPNVVLLDIDLAGIHAGLEVLEIINKQYKEIRPIVITGRAKHLREQIEEIGCFDFFDKPVDLRKLSDRVKDALGIEKIIEEKAPELLKATPKARLLFIEPNLYLYAYLCSLFDSKEMLNGAEYTVKVIEEINNILNVLSEFKPDIVLIGDYIMEDAHILNLVDIIQSVAIKPRSVVVHGLFERKDVLEARLKMMGVKHVVQNVMDNELILKMNRRLTDFVAQECIERGLVKE